MATLFKTSVLHVDPEQAWKRIADVGRVNEILPAIASCDLQGDIRICKLANGVPIKERVISLEPELKRLSYTILESPFGLEFHSASMQIVPEGKGARIFWTTDIKPDAMKDALSPLVDQMFDQLTERLSAP